MGFCLMKKPCYRHRVVAVLRSVVKVVKSGRPHEEIPHTVARCISLLKTLFYFTLAWIKKV